MITGRDTTPEERRRYARSFHFNAVSGTIFAVIFIAIGVIDIARVHRQAYDYVQFAMGIAWLVIARANWVRWRKYAS